MGTSTVTLKIKTALGFETLHPQTEVAQIIGLSAFTSKIVNLTAVTPAGITNSDALVFADYSNSYGLQRGPVINTSGLRYLKENGNWDTLILTKKLTSDTTYAGGANGRDANLTINLDQYTYYHVRFFGSFSRLSGAAVPFTVGLRAVSSITYSVFRGSGRYQASAVTGNLIVTTVDTAISTTSNEFITLNSGGSAQASTVFEIEAIYYTGLGTGIGFSYNNPGGGGTVTLEKGSHLVVTKL